MMIRKTSLCAGSVLLGIALSVGQVTTTRAQAPAASVTTAAPETFDYELGASEMNGATYSVKATQPLDSKLKGQKVRFVWKSATAVGTTTHYFTINTGKFKTIAQLTAYLRETFAKFLAGAPANAEVGKVGDIKYGGEIRFVAESAEVLRCDSMTEGTTSPTPLARADVKAFSAILSGGAR